MTEKYDEAFSAMFGSDEHLAMLKRLEEKERPFRAGETHRLSLEFFNGDAPAAKIECLEMDDPERACSIRDHGKPIPETCVLQELWTNIGWDGVNIVKNGEALRDNDSAILKLDLPVGYDSEGSGEDYEDWFVVHLKGS